MQLSEHHNGGIAKNFPIEASACFLNSESILTTPLEYSTRERPDFYIYHWQWRNGKIPVAIAEHLRLAESGNLIDIIHEFPELYMVDYRRYGEVTFDQDHRGLSREWQSVKAGMVFGAVLCFMAILMLRWTIGIGRTLFFELLKTVCLKVDRTLSLL